MTDQPPQQPPPGYGYPGPDPAANPAGPYGYPQTGAPQGGYQQTGPPQGGYQQTGYPGAGHQQGGYPPPGYPPPGYPPPGGYVPPPGTYTGDPNAPYGYDPFGRPYSDKSKIVAGILQLALGTLGVGRFYIGHIGLGLAQLFTCGGLGIWALIDGIVLLTNSHQTDSDGRVLRG